jgi:hypothetical protein
MIFGHYFSLQACSHFRRQIFQVQEYLLPIKEQETVQFFRANQTYFYCKMFSFYMSKYSANQNNFQPIYMSKKLQFQSAIKPLILAAILQ